MLSAEAGGLPFPCKFFMHLSRILSAFEVGGARQRHARRGARRQRGFIVFAWLALLVLASQTTLAEIAIVRSSDAAPYAEAETALRAGLADRHQQLRSFLLKEVVEKGATPLGHPDSVVAIGTSAARWLHQKLPADAKLVYCMVNDAGEAGLLAGNATWGVTTEVSMADQCKLISEVIPTARAVGVLYRADIPEGRRPVALLQAALPHDWRVESVAVKDGATAAAAIDALIEKNVDVIWTMADPKLYDSACVRTLLLGGLRKKIPVWGFSPSFVRAGALLGVGVEPRAQGDQAAAIVAGVLDSKAPAAGRVEAPAQFQIAVNLNVAQQIGVKIPESVSARAAYVFRPE